MKTSHIIAGVLGIAIVAGSLFLIPDAKDLTYMAQNAKPQETTPEVITEEKQKILEEKITREGLLAPTVSELADSYMAQGKTDKAIELMERYHQKNPKDLQMLDKLGVIYHVAGKEDKYIGILEEQNEIAPSVNISYILQANYSKLYNGESHHDKTIRVLRHLIQLQPENPQNYKVLIFFLIKAKLGKEVIPVVKEFRAKFPNQMDYGLIFPLVEQLINIEMFDEAYKEAEPWAKEHPDPALKDFTTMFTNARRPDLAMKLLEGHPDVLGKDPAMLMVSVKAALINEPAKALEIATSGMKANSGDPKMLEDFGNLFSTAKRYDETVTLYTPYKSTVLSHRPLLDIYRESLIRSIKNKPENLALLTEIYETELNDPKTTPERRKALVLSLQDMGATSKALHYGEKYAYRYRGDWVLIYEAMLEKTRDKQKLAAFRSKYVHSVKLTDEERRYYISIYMEQANKPEAERLMWEQAQGKPPTSREVRDLVYLWGVHPGAEQQKWLEQQASAATGEDQLEWVKILQDIGAYESVIRVVSTVPEKSRPLPMLKYYFDALRMVKDQSVRIAESTIAIDDENDEQRLAFYAKSAQDLGQFRLASRGYERLIGMNPNNIEYLKERGMTAYYSGDADAATACLDAYYAAGGKDILAIFYYAELVLQRNSLQAEPLFQQTLLLMEKAPNLSMQEKVLKIHTLARLHRIPEARKEMAELRQQNPENPYLYLDNVEFLIDTNEFKKAENMLKETPPQKIVGAPSQLWRLDSDQVMRVETRIKPNELLLVYTKPISKVPQVKQYEQFHPLWLSGYYPGYDSVLISAEENKKLFASFEGDNLIIQANDIVPAGQPEADASLAVRRELLQARIEQETHRRAQAIERIEKLHEKSPEDIAILAGLANANRSYGKRLKALDLAEEAHRQDPQNRWVNIMIADIKKEDQPRIGVDAEWLHLGSGNRFVTQATGLAPITRNLRVGVTAENNIYNYKNLRNSRGDIARENGSTQRGQIDAIYETEAGPISKTSLYLNPGATLGVGQAVTTHDFLGPVTAYVEYKRSDWLFLERLPNDVTRNRIGIHQLYAPIPQVSSAFGAAVSEYSQDNKKNATKSISLNGNIHAPVSQFNEDWNDVPVIVGYGLDAEYVTSAAYGTNSTGDRYRYYPMISREVHFLDASYRKPFSNTLVGDLTGAVAYDRMTDQGGPSVGGRLTKELKKGWEVQVRASHGISFTQQGAGVTAAGGYVVKKFE